MKKTIGVLAHVDAGKTTFAEQILYHTKSIRTLGRVDHKNSFLDKHDIEKERGITVFSDQALFKYNDNEYYLIDTPGHVDFSTEMERALEIMDYAILIISGVDGIQAHTETVWELLRKKHIPTFFFINKIDREISDIENVLNDIETKFTNNVCLIDKTLNGNDMDNQLIEFIAERDEKLLEIYLDSGYEKELWLNSMKKQISKGMIFPCLSGSALLDVNIDKFIEKLDLLTYTNYEELDEKFKGKVYKIRYDEKGNKVTYIKALNGSLKVKDSLYCTENEIEFNEKINQIRIYNSDKFILEDTVYAGDVFGVTGLTKFKIGQGIGEADLNTYYNIVLTLKSKVVFNKSVNTKEILSYFKILEEEDPGLNVLWDDDLQEMNIHIMGKIQLEVLKEVVKERFKLDIEFGDCEVLYKETIGNKVNGYGHFEPLRHYAEVHLQIEPGKRNSGVTFESKCHVDNLNIGYQRLIQSHIFEKEHKGILTGSKICDVKITLINGKSHLKHTSGGDFREATYRAIRQGLEQGNNILLEPYYKLKVTVENEYVGRVLSDIQRLFGSFNEQETLENKTIIFGRGPVATFMNYNMDLISFTKGKGVITLSFDGYDECHNSDEVIQKIKYKKESDREYTSSSVFCSKGQGYIVKWSEVQDHMHCLQ
ncbi:elongation factor G [Clostridium botulinum]|uniref:GTP-binding protein n=1 Tax=Clostridium botulinum TaxID=1491 RepID=UPI000596D6AA|nr:TetM/TetW/TetO/TetS family tetracycline resistance ribosomal protection protein [Clostridium botulinum]KIL07278.1 elongation factor G [Clostridium botulinum]MBY6934314.1 TetM/TetW/TetO/TetS family tetracycline resistance ribosomal protection protein [Clostridium botulinum]NFN12128.1 TetM/TetW/TetO/TetS family tetracycline resistance ribosomal protection protein [Clostridium botulinum]NFO38146.1 TetM/TetW/TetO/TetS family tetracycline resistance ribosomal protection protein [Clostridium botul